METKDARFLDCTAAGVGDECAGSTCRSTTMEALFLPGDRKNSDLRVSVHFLFLSFFHCFFSVSFFDYAGWKSNLFWKHYLGGFCRLRIDIKISLFVRQRIKKKILLLKIFWQITWVFLRYSQCVLLDILCTETFVIKFIQVVTQ